MKNLALIALVLAFLSGCGAAALARNKAEHDARVASSAAWKKENDAWMAAATKRLKAAGMYYPTPYIPGLYHSPSYPPSSFWYSYQPPLYPHRH